MFWKNANYGIIIQNFFKKCTVSITRMTIMLWINAHFFIKLPKQLSNKNNAKKIYTKAQFESPKHLHQFLFLNWLFSWKKTLAKTLVLISLDHKIEYFKDLFPGLNRALTTDNFCRGPLLKGEGLIQLNFLYLLV